MYWLKIGDDKERKKNNTNEGMSDPSFIPFQQKKTKHNDPSSCFDFHFFVFIFI